MYKTSLSENFMDFLHNIKAHGQNQNLACARCSPLVCALIVVMPSHSGFTLQLNLWEGQPRSRGSVCVVPGHGNKAGSLIFPSPRTIES